MNNAIYTKSGKLRKNPPPKYVIRGSGVPVPDSRLQKINLPGIGFLMGPYGEQLDDNPDYKEWMRLIEDINLLGEVTEE